MPWAPAEFSPDERSFADEQVFDLGLLYVNLGIIELARYKDQGGEFQREFQSPGVRWLVFEIEAEGFTFQEKYYIEVRAENCAKSSTWPGGSRAVVVRIEKERLNLILSS